MTRAAGAILERRAGTAVQLETRPCVGSLPGSPAGVPRKPAVTIEAHLPAVAVLYSASSSMFRLKTSLAMNL